MLEFPRAVRWLAPAAALAAATTSAPAGAQQPPPSGPAPAPAPQPGPYPPQAYPPPQYPPPAGYPPQGYPGYPPPGYPPPGYPPPGYPPPYPYGYPPPYPAPTPPPQPPAIIYDWDPAAPVPAGYHLDETIGKSFGTGCVLLGTGWFLSILAGAVGAAGEEDEDPADADDVTADDWAALYIPVAGPFIALGTLDPNTSGVGALLADGVVQVGGAVGIVVGLVDKRYRLVRHDYGVRISPFTSARAHGLVASGTF